MTRKELRIMVLGQLTTTLTKCVIVDGLPTEEDNSLCWDIQQQIAKHFQNRIDRMNKTVIQGTVGGRIKHER